MSTSLKTVSTVAVFLGVLLVCTGLKGEVQDGFPVNKDYQQQALKERKKLSKKAYRQYLADPQLDKKATDVLYKLYQLPCKDKSIFAVHNSYSFKNGMRNRVSEITGRKPLLNGIEMTHALDEHWSLFSNDVVPSGPDINERYYSFLLDCVRTGYERDGSVPVITYHMANPYSPLPPKRYGAYQEYKDKEHRNVVGEMRKGTGSKCGFKGEYNTPREFLDAKLDAFAEFLVQLKDRRGNPIPCIIENCYATGTITSKGYVGAVAGNVNNVPVFIRNVYTNVNITGNGTATNLCGGIVGRVRTALTLENCYSAGSIEAPVAAPIAAGGQADDTEASLYRNVIAWNRLISGKTVAVPFAVTAGADVLTGTHIFEEMLVNDEPVEGGETHAQLQAAAAQWGAPWHADPAAGNGYPILQWQYERGDYAELCGFPKQSGIIVSAGQKAGDGTVYDLTGRRVASGHQSGAADVDVHALAPGVYMLFIEQKDHTLTRKVVANFVYPFHIYDQLIGLF